MTEIKRKIQEQTVEQNETIQRVAQEQAREIKDASDIKEQVDELKEAINKAAQEKDGITYQLPSYRYSGISGYTIPGATGHSVSSLARILSPPDLPWFSFNRMVPQESHAWSLNPQGQVLHVTQHAQNDDEEMMDES